MQKNWRIKDLLLWTTRHLADRGMQEARLEAEILLAHALDKDRVYLYANYEKPINPDERTTYRDYIRRRTSGEPVAYIVGEREFMSLRFEVGPQVLIPRPDTELLVETGLQLASREEMNRICDVGTGSGAIAVSLAAYLPKATVYAVDISPEALQIAGRNAACNQVHIDLRLGDLLAPLQGEEPLDMVVANLPYVTAQELLGLEAEVREFEPHLALVAPGDGLDIYRRLVPQALEVLRPGGYLLMEIDPRQAEAALALLDDFIEVEKLVDGGGRDRMVMGRRNV